MNNVSTSPWKQKEPLKAVRTKRTSKPISLLDITLAVPKDDESSPAYVNKKLRKIIIQVVSL